MQVDQFLWTLLKTWMVQYRAVRFCRPLLRCQELLVSVSYSSYFPTAICAAKLCVFLYIYLCLCCFSFNKHSVIDTTSFTSAAESGENFHSTLTLHVNFNKLQDWYIYHTSLCKLFCNNRWLQMFNIQKKPMMKAYRAHVTQQRNKSRYTCLHMNLKSHVVQPNLCHKEWTPPPTQQGYSFYPWQ